MVLANKLGIDNAAELARKEEELSKKKRSNSLRVASCLP